MYLPDPDHPVRKAATDFLAIKLPADTYEKIGAQGISGVTPETVQTMSGFLNAATITLDTVIRNVHLPVQRPDLAERVAQHDATGLYATTKIAEAAKILDGLSQGKLMPTKTIKNELQQLASSEVKGITPASKPGFFKIAASLLRMKATLLEGFLNIIDEQNPENRVQDFLQLTHLMRHGEPADGPVDIAEVQAEYNLMGRRARALADELDKLQTQYDQIIGKALVPERQR